MEVARVRTWFINAILAECGSDVVPAEQASTPIRDQLYCRIGHADDQEHTISTFMLEMKEAAFIRNNATTRSLVLADELDHATSNEDGVAIAWSLCECTYLLKK
jgi:DNA mismatch repair protein MSH4